MRATTFQEYKKRILRVLLHIQRNLDRDLELSDLASVAAFSPYHFHRVFRGMVGESVREHVRRLRLERAAMRLKSSNWPVTRVALDAGYEAHESFTRAFRAMFGASPSGFRANNASVPLAAGPSNVHFRPEGDVKDFEARGEEGEPMKVQIQTLAPMRVAFMRHTGPYDQCGKVWERFMAWAGSEGLLGAGTTCLGLCHDDPDVTPPDKIRYDCCLTVDDGFAPEGEVGVQEVAGGEYAVTTHFGSYDRLKETYDRLYGGWLPRSGRQPRSAPCFEVYLNGPEDTDPEDLLTDIHVPLEPRG